MRVKIAIIFAYFNTPEEISRAVSSIPDAVGKLSYEIIIVDNNSSKPVPGNIKSLKRVKIIKNKKNEGYGQALNIGAKSASGKYLLFSNTDTFYSTGSIKELVKELEKNPKLGVVGPKMVDEAGNILLSRSYIPSFPLTIFIYSSLKNLPGFRKAWERFNYIGKNSKVVEVVGGASMLVRKDVFEAIGGFDHQFFLFFEEADICKRIRKAGYEVKYLPTSSVVHSVGGSLSDREQIKKYFELSRFRFIYKHQGFVQAILSEAVIKLFSLTTILLLGIFVLSLFTNLYKITSLMMFFGDFARDLLAARDMVLEGHIPLLGIPSSVVWLHQGPLSIYLIGLSFLVGGFSAWVPAVFYAILGSLSSILVYFLGKSLFSRQVGIFSAAIFAASPLVIVNVRIPYHTAPVPFFTTLLFLFLYKFLKSNSDKHLFLVGLFLGILFQLELSNGLLVFVIGILFFLNKIRFSIRRVLLLIASFALGILPFLIYDLSHRFTQTLGFAAWVANRIRLFFGISLSGMSTNEHLPSALILIRDQLVRFVFPQHFLIAYIVITASVVFLIMKVLKKRKSINLQLISIGLFIPLFGFAIHSQPGTAYFPVVFPLFAIMIGFFFSSLLSRWRLSYLIFGIFLALNVLFTVQNSFFLHVNGKGGADIKYWNYGLGISYREQEELVSFIKRDSNGQAVSIQPGGFLTKFKTSIDNYRYIAWQMGIKESSRGIEYTIYQDMNEIPKDANLVFRTEGLAVVKNE